MQAAQARTTKRPNAVGTAAAGVGLAAVILCTGMVLASGVRSKGGELVVQQVFKSEAELHSSENKLLQAKTLTLLREYMFAFADAAIQFETVPKLDTRLFYSIVTAMPEAVEVVGISFDGYDLMLACTADTIQARDGFIARLQEDQQTHTTIESELPTDDAARVCFQLRCAAREQPGELRFDAPEEEAESASVLGRIWPMS